MRFFCARFCETPDRSHNILSKPAFSSARIPAALLKKALLQAIKNVEKFFVAAAFCRKVFHS